MSVTAGVTVSVAIVTILQIETTPPATYDLIELCQSNTVSDEHDSSEDTSGNREAHKTTNLYTEKKWKSNKRKEKMHGITWEEDLMLTRYRYVFCIYLGFCWKETCFLCLHLSITVCFSSCMPEMKVCHICTCGQPRRCMRLLCYVTLRCDEMRWDEVSWDEMGWAEMGWAELR